LLKFQFALEQRIDESQEMILNELKSGPYELIHDPDVKEIWKSESFACSDFVSPLQSMGPTRHREYYGYFAKEGTYPLQGCERIQCETPAVY
jgi:hypothetical protein